MAITPTYGNGSNGNDYAPNKYAELGNAIGTIAEQVIRGVRARNPLAVFDKIPVNNGDTIEQMVVKLVENSAYDRMGPDTLKRATNSKLAVQLFKDWTPYKYKQSIDFSEMRKVLTGERSDADLAEMLIGALSQSDIRDNFNYVKGLLKYGSTAAGTPATTPLVNLGTVAAVGSSVDYKGVLKKIKDIVKGFSFVSTAYNSAGLDQRTPNEDIYIIMPFTLKNAIDVDELSGVFNLSKAEIEDKIIETDATDNIVYVVDRNAVLVYTRLYEMWDQKNAEGRFWNYYLHIERLYALSPLFNGVFFTVGQPAAK